MKRIVLTTFIFLAAWRVFAVDPASPIPVKLDKEIMEAFEGSVPDMEVKDIKNLVNSFMLKLANKYHDTRLDGDLAPAYCIKRKDGLSPVDSQDSLDDVVCHLAKASNTSKKKDIILDFCEGYNDGIRYLKGEFSALQIIEYAQYNCFRASLYMGETYRAGVNTAMKGQSFPWKEALLFEKT